MKFGVVFCSIFLSRISNVHAAYSYSLEEGLRTSLGIGTSYNVFVRPTLNVNVTVALNLITLNSLSIGDQSMALSAYLTIFWSDQRLNWTSDSAYNSDIPSIYSNEEYIWRPPLIIENSVSDVSVISDTKVLMRIEQSGAVSWTPSGIYTTHCDTDVTFYPFDTQKCDIIVTSWGYTSIEISLLIASYPVRLGYYKENGEWEYKGYTTSSTSNTREGSTTPELTFTLTFKRRPAFHILNSLIPMILLACLSAMIFKLPPDSGEKIGYTLTVLLAYAVYLTIISDDMPSTSSSTSILTVYLVLILALGVISVILTIFVLDCHHKDNELPVPAWLVKMATGCMAPFACWKDHKCFCTKRIKPVSEKSDKTIKGDLEGEEKITWQDICHILDAFFLRVYLILIATLTVLLILALVIGYAVL